METDPPAESIELEPAATFKEPPVNPLPATKSKAPPTPLTDGPLATKTEPDIPSGDEPLATFT
jgi:hypothetical protein